MNDKPHSHEVRVHDMGSYWGIFYGDQGPEIPSKPIHWPWVSEASHQRHLEDALRRNVRKIVGRHDRATQRAAERARRERGMTFTFRPDQWASDQMDGMPE